MHQERNNKHAEEEPVQQGSSSSLSTRSSTGIFFYIITAWIFAIVINTLADFKSKDLIKYGQTENAKKKQVNGMFLFLKFVPLLKMKCFALLELEKNKSMLFYY